MVDSSEKRRDVIGLIISAIVMLITLISFFTISFKQIPIQAYIIFGIIVLVLLIGFFITYITSRWREMNVRIETNATEITNIKNSLNLDRLFRDMDKRLSILEQLFDRFYPKKNKRAQIDPRIIFWILLIILLLLFLKSLGVFG